VIRESKGVSCLEGRTEHTERQVLRKIFVTGSIERQGDNEVDSCVGDQINW
jgi:hypothetical protein